MDQPDSQQYPHGGAPHVTSAAIGRLAALGGVGFLVASLASDLAIGPFPGPDTPPAQLVSFYAAHHAQVQAGGILLAASGVFFILFGTAVWARIQQMAARPLLAGLTIIATALVGVTTLISAGAYGILGDIGGLHGVAPAALQAWHIMGSDGSLANSVSTCLFLLAVAGAGILARALPRWLAWTALPLAVLQLVPNQIGFLASLVFLVWTVAAGVALLFARQVGRTTYAIREEVSHA